MIRIFLSGSDLNRLLPLVPDMDVFFEDGCLRIYKKLKMGGAHLVFVPCMEGRDVVLAVPFSEIRGDVSGRFAASIARTLWGPISSQVQQQAAIALARYGLSTDTVEIDQITDDAGERIGLIRISLTNINVWLTRQRWLQPLAVVIETVEFTPHGLTMVLEARQPQRPLAISGVTLPPPPSYN